MSQYWQRNGQPVRRTNTVGQPTVAASPCSDRKISVIFRRSVVDWTISLGTAAQLIRQLNDAMGLTSIVVSHDLEETFRLADHVIILGEGVVAAQGTPEEVLASRDPLVHQFVNALPAGPVPFHYPGPAVAKDFGPVGGRAL